MAFHKYKEILHFSVNFYSLFLIVTFIPDIINIDNLMVKNLFWGIKVLLASWIVFRNRRSFLYLKPIEVLFLIVVTIYAINIFVNVFLNPLPFMKMSVGFMDFIGFCIGIVVALSFRYDPDFHSEKSFNFFWVSLAIGLVLAYFFAIENLILDVHNLRYDANSTVNSINYGQMGCALSLVSMFGIINCRKNLLKALFIITFIIGIISIAKAGSRSPVVVLALVSIFYFIARLGSIKGIFIFSALILLLFIFQNVLIGLLESVGSSLAVRLTSMVVEQETSGRDEIYSNVIRIIEREPIFGAYYLIPSGVGARGYPHNFFLEVFMTTGIVGGLPFMFLVFVSLYKAYKLIQSQHPSSWIIILYLQIIVFGMFSTGLYTSQDFWTLLFFVLSINILAKNTSKKPHKVTEPSHKVLVLNN